jgi:hypothetical protein
VVSPARCPSAQYGRYEEAGQRKSPSGRIYEVTPVVQQLLTLVGVVLGAGATYAATSRTERTKWQRSQDTRWDDKRLAAYSEYANALKRWLQVSYRLAAERGYSNGTQPVDRETGLHLLTEAEADRTVKWETVLLLGSPEAVRAGRRWHQAVWEIHDLGLREPIDQDAYTRGYQKMVRRRQDFYRHARTDLNVKSGELPAPSRNVLTPANPVEGSEKAAGSLGVTGTGSA